MQVYFINLFVLVFILYTLRNNEKKMYKILFLWLFLFGALRGKIGADYDSYLAYFNIFKKVPWNSLSTWGIEKGYFYLNKIVWGFKGNYQCLLAVCSFFSTYGIICFIKKYAIAPWWSIWYYITFFFYQSTWTRLRQGIAVGIVMIAYQYAIEKKKLSFILAVLIATLFHTTAIITLVIYPIVHYHVKSKDIIILGLTIPMISFGNRYVRKVIFELSNLVLPSYNRYNIGTATVSGEGVILLFIFCLVLIFELILFFEQKTNYYSVESTNIFAINFLIVAVIFQAFSISVNLINRINMYFATPAFLLLPNIIQTKLNSKNRSLFYFVVGGITLFYYWFQLRFGATAAYHFFWNTKKFMQ